MNASAILKALEDRRATVVVKPGGRLGITPAHAVTPDLAQEIKAHKIELLELLGPLTPSPAPNAIWNTKVGIWLHLSGLWRYYTPSPGVAQVQNIRRKHVGLIQAAEDDLLPPGPCPLAAGMECSDPTQAVLGIAAMLRSIMQAVGDGQRDLTADEAGQLEEADAALLYLSAAWQETGWEVPAIDPPGTQWSAPAPVHQLAFDNAA